MKRIFLFIILSVTLFISCKKDNQTFDVINESISYEEKLEFLLNLGCQKDDINAIGENFIVEGDIMVSFKVIDLMIKESNGSTKSATQYSYPNAFYITQNNVSNVKIYNNANDLSASWLTAFSEAVKEWNSISNSVIRFSIVDNISNADILIGTKYVSGAWVALANPPSNGKAGRNVTVNTYYNSMSASEKKNTIVHELGHTIGFAHTNGTSNFCTPVHIAGTRGNAEKASVMYRYTHSWTGFTNDDLIAARVMFPKVYLLGYDLQSPLDNILPLNYNGDGYDDLMFYRPGSRIAYFGSSNGDGTFNRQFASHNGLSSYDIASSVDKAVSLDYNGDGKDDVLLYRPGNRIAYVLNSKGDGTFSTKWSSHSGISSYDIASVNDKAVSLDYNGDGKDDVLFYRSGHRIAYVLRSNGDGSFSTQWSSHNGISSYDIASERDRALSLDYNGDGKDDVMFYRPGDGIAYVLRSNGDGSFTTQRSSHSGIAGYDIASERDRAISLDYNGDGKDDVMFYRPGDRIAYILSSNGDGSFTRQTASHNGFNGFDIANSNDKAASLDFNGDGKDDVLFYRPGHGNLYINLSNGDGNFQSVLRQ